MNLVQELYHRIEKEGLWDKNFTLKRNEFLKTAGITETDLYFVKSGSLKVFMLHDDEEYIIRFGYRNDFITALDSFISNKPSDFYIQAIKKSELKAISKTKFLNFIREHSKNLELWDEILQQLILQHIEREKDLLIKSPKERFLRVFNRSPGLFQEIPHKHIASYLRMSPETLSRLKKS